MWAIGSMPCCSGLRSVFNTVRSADGVACDFVIPGTFVCTKCENGQCGLKENDCNCPEDCPRAVSSSSSSRSFGGRSSSRQAAVCGNGIAEKGEACGEPGLSCPVGKTCLSCQCIIVAASSSSSSSSSSISSVSSAPITGSSSSQTAHVCGNATLESGEQCELGMCCPNGQSCDTRTCQCTLVSQVPAQNSVCGNFRVEPGEDCENGISTPQLPCIGTAVCDSQTCRCPAGTARCPRWRSTP